MSGGNSRKRWPILLISISKLQYGSRAESPAVLSRKDRVLYLLDLEPPRFLLNTIEDQEALYLDFAEAMSAQQLPATMNRELGYNHDAHILSTNANFT